jgi:protein gp37
MPQKTSKKLSLSSIGYINELVPWVYGWNPFGWGCTNKTCPTCYAKAQARQLRMQEKPFCDKCANFEVHMHPERLGSPANTPKPGVVLGNFMNDWFDLNRPIRDVLTVLNAMLAAPWHNYVTCTKNPVWFAPFEFFRDYGLKATLDDQVASGMSDFRHAGQARIGQPNWYHGLTIRGQMDMGKLETFLQVKGNTWLSLEPLWGQVVFGNHELEKSWRVIDWKEDTPVSIDRNDPESRKVDKWHRKYPILGIIVGHDSVWEAPGTRTLRHVRSVVRQCRDTLTPCFVKQLWMGKCDQCGAVGELEEGDTESTWECSACAGGPHPTGRLKPKLIDDPALFPEDIRVRDLPWRMPAINPKQ